MKQSYKVFGTGGWGIDDRLIDDRKYSKF